jgi:hypothetical protein
LLVNNSTDRTAALARNVGGLVRVIEHEFDPARAHAGAARAQAIDCAAEALTAQTDVLLTTDADTVVAPDWLARTLDHLDAGYDAVCGIARFAPVELRRLPRHHRLRLANLRRYFNAQQFLQARISGDDEPDPRHFYEGGASIALTHAMLRTIAPLPSPAHSEDKALVDCVRRAGGKVRHPTDVRVSTSCRLVGRAEQGVATTLSRWVDHAPEDPIHEVTGIETSLGLDEATPISFARLAAETERARQLVKALKRRTAGQDNSAAPDIQPVLGTALRPLHRQERNQEP